MIKYEFRDDDDDDIGTYAELLYWMGLLTSDIC